MAELSFKITFDLGAQMELSRAINAQTFPMLSQAVSAVTQQTAINWQKAVYTAKLWSGEKEKYANSITWKMTGDFSGEVVASYSLADQIEKGRPPYDMKKMLQTSLKVRRSKKGVRYLFIPFRHNTPGNDAHAPSMPQSVYDLAKDLAPSSVVGMTTRKSGQTGKSHLTIPQRKYNWGGSLPAGLSQKLKPHHKSDIHAGMYRFDTSTPGGAKSSAFLTFRTMSEKSTGWIKPAKPGLNIAKGVSDAMQPKAEQAFAMAIKKTLSNG